MDLYFVHIPATDTGPDQTHELLALACDEQGRPGAGVVMTMTAVAARRIAEKQIGAIRWHQAGEVSEIYVAPTMRRQGVATALWNTARNLHIMTTGRPLRISGRRTVLGDLLAQRVCDPSPPLDELVLPMTPRAEAEGAEQHQLAPDDIDAALNRYRYLGVPVRLLRAYCAPTAEQAWIQRSRARRR
ncbi:GNAT family N-acetyltransferase [Nocardiopsis alborubida]|uniref:GNAT family N-acetyltransferase n=1 Tax=Nocardiopsis alborubida TaxID=146802 RepID=A0A7X6MB84_9ACTN|nr:GNAT family N-acetyltransferase [Nocardiopsis alborubida]NKY96570.1 GNAT family N-acetyltransferase [Nocardiopsis alborubida]